MNTRWRTSKETAREDQGRIMLNFLQKKMRSQEITRKCWEQRWEPNDKAEQKVIIICHFYCKKWHTKVFACPEWGLERKKEPPKCCPCSDSPCGTQQTQWKWASCNRRGWMREGKCLIPGFYIPMEWVAICILWDWSSHSFFHGFCRKEKIFFLLFYF